MPHIQVNTALVSAALRDAATTLKAAVAVSAAAILSQAKADLEANAAAALGHLDAFRNKLDALRDAILHGRGNAMALATISNVGTAEVDTDALAAKIAIIDGRLDRFKEALLTIVGSAERDGLDVFAERAGALGRAFQDLAFTAGEPIAAAPFQFDQFFLETMADLGQRDWSDAAEGPTS
ncbi:MAG: hypothetical protein JWR89_829 [Tardiphaga sp.]|jgi:hypothetical protein|uniref:hypothetical protein n=1 Tax=Tardiphaga sp. TaxID=1926292 RepID=UPI002607CF87|nr:hypothetical protein [Tardiphaga sp.]MDB5500927.1 hypothetical protein [Tardiphaga sp.]